jgi:hypothetical protein
MAAVNNPVDAFVYNSGSDDALVNSLLEIANTGLWCNQEVYNTAVQFFKNPANINALKEAKDGMGLPAKNRESERGFLKKTKDYCDWGDLYKFYYYAKLAKTFPKLNPNNKENCYKIEGIIEGLQSEKTQRNKIYVSTNDLEKYKKEEEVLSLKIAEFNALFASMSCEVYMRDELDKRAEDARIKSEEEAQSILKETFADTQKASQNTTKIATYVAIGVAVLIGGLVVIKVLKK